MQFHLFLSAIICFVFMKVLMGLKVEGHENIPRRGGVIIASNHISNWDPPILGVATALRRDVFFLAKEELFYANKFYSLLISKYGAIPIKRQAIDKKAIRISSFHLRKKRVIVIFPEGKRNPGKGFLKPLPGVGYLALKTKAKVIPTYIEGSEERMIDLIMRRKRILVRFGNPIDLFQLKSNGSLLKRSIKLSNLVMKEISDLRKNV
jgi:1-acyl-sn-glycerol-3-phosphate acyltransferase